VLKEKLAMMNLASKVQIEPLHKTKKALMIMNQRIKSQKRNFTRHFSQTCPEMENWEVQVYLMELVD